LAASIRSGASVIVTCNLADFPCELLREFGVEAQHPDEFILNLLDLAPGLVIEAAENHQQSLKNPPKAVEEYLRNAVQVYKVDTEAIDLKVKQEFAAKDKATKAVKTVVTNQTVEGKRAA
jgi:hypothetical protein